MKTCPTCGTSENTELLQAQLKDEIKRWREGVEVWQKRITEAEKGRDNYKAVADIHLKEIYGLRNSVAEAEAKLEKVGSLKMDVEIAELERKLLESEKQSDRWANMASWVVEGSKKQAADLYKHLALMHDVVEAARYAPAQLNHNDGEVKIRERLHAALGALDRAWPKHGLIAVPCVKAEVETEDLRTGQALPVGACPKCNCPVYTKRGFCGRCE